MITLNNELFLHLWIVCYTFQKLQVSHSWTIKVQYSGIIIVHGVGEGGNQYLESYLNLWINLPTNKPLTLILKIVLKATFTSDIEHWAMMAFSCLMATSRAWGFTSPPSHTLPRRPAAMVGFSKVPFLKTGTMLCLTQLWSWLCLFFRS